MCTKFGMNFMPLEYNSTALFMAYAQNYDVETTLTPFNLEY